MPDLDSLLAPNPFAGDDGSIEPALAAAFACSPHERAQAVVAALADGRVLVGAVPHSSHSSHSFQPNGLSDQPDGLPDSGLLANPQGLIRVNFSPGRRAYAIFSSADSYTTFTTTYNIGAQVRPVPVKARASAALAITRGEGLLVLDPGSEYQQWIGRSAAAALATGELWIPPWEDPHVAEHITAAIPADFPGFRGARVDPGDGGSAVVTVTLTSGTTAEQIAMLITALSDVIATEPYVKARLDVVELRPAWIEQ